MTYLRKVFLDKENYLTGFTDNLDGTNEYELTIEILHSNRLNCWKLQNGRFVYDEVKANEQIRIENIKKEIAELKQKLADTDYIWNVIKEGDATVEDYAEVIANRHIWRLRIRELEKELEGE